jgi:pyruvate kinase
LLASSFKRTKIVATIGPASWAYECMEELMAEGTNCFRMNFSHGTYEEYLEVIKNARRAQQKLDKPIALLQDLQGPKIRVGSLPSDGLPMVRGAAVKFKSGADYDKNGIIPLQYDFTDKVKAGQSMHLRDGLIEVKIDKIERRQIEATVTVPGILYSNQGINLPDADFGGDILTDKDIRDIRWGAEQDVDYVALSFVQTAADIIGLKDRLNKLKSAAKVIAKIETKAAVSNLEEIIQAADGVMVARGDLAIETRPEAVPVIQDRIVALARRHQKVVIVATQMLESMTQAPQPTRAEVSDVARAVMGGADAVMLSGETASGNFPVQTVAMMKRIIRYTEGSMPVELHINFNDHATRANAISAAAIILARQVGAKAIIAETTSGQTARNLASFRPPMPIVMVTHNQRVYQQMAVVWGGKAYLSKSMIGASQHVIRELKKAGNVAPGDSIVIASGNQPGISGGTNNVQVLVVE